MKILKNILLITITFFVFALNIYANEINSIDIEVFIDNAGTANVTEVWKVNATEGTEMYKSYGNLDGYELTNFKVKDETRDYKSLSSWNLDASFSSKAYKSGINKTSDGIELCFGISEYGENTYTLTYKISKIVLSLDDTQVVYFSFMPQNMNVSVEQVNIKIKTYYDINLENAQIWAFGYNGEVQFEGNYITMFTSDRLESHNYMTLLAEFKNDRFAQSHNIDYTFEELFNEATEKIKDDEEYEEFWNDWRKKHEFQQTFTNDILPVIMTFIGLASPLIVVFIVFKASKYKGKRLKFKNIGGKSLPKKDDLKYQRDIPCNKNVFRAYLIANEYGFIKNQGDIIGAILLKWIKEEKVSIIKGKEKIFKFKDNNYNIDLTKEVKFDDEREEKLFDMLVVASEDKILESKEFERWLRKNYIKLDKWFIDIEEQEIKEMQKEGYISSDKQVELSFKEEAIKLVGLKKFLLEFSVIDTRKAPEVVLWEEYLIFAAVLGIADKVEEQFSKIYPEFKDLTKFDTNTVIITRSFAYNAMRAVNVAHSSNNASSFGGFSGGGGGSSFGGGGSSSGGFSSGGGGFR